MERARQRTAKLESLLELAQLVLTPGEAPPPPEVVRQVLHGLTELVRSYRESEGFYRLLFEESPVPVCLAEEDGTILAVNEALLRTTGFTREEVVAMGARGLYFAPETRAALVERLSADGALKDVVVRFRHKGGDVIWASFNVIPFHRDGKTLRIGVAVDVTKRMDAEAELRRYQERLRDLTAQLSDAEERERRRMATVLHDRVSQELVGMKLSLEFVKEAPSSPESRLRLERLLERVDALGEEVRSMTFELYPPVLHDLGLEAGLGWLAERFAGQSGIGAACEVEAGVPTLEDPERIFCFRAVQELLRNVASHAEARRVTIRLARSADEVTLSVEDDGKGFAPTEPESGFGLFSIRERLRLLGGRMDIRSAAGLGTTVRLLLPAGAARATRGTP